MSDSGSGPTSAGTNLSPSSTHHVKQLLATYAKNASHSLTGPSAIEEQSRFSKYTKFKLNNDVSLSKVYPSQEAASDRPSNGKEGGGGVEGGVYEQLNKQLMLSQLQDGGRAHQALLNSSRLRTHGIRWNQDKGEAQALMMDTDEL